MNKNNHTSTKKTIMTCICQKCQKEKHDLGFVSLDFNDGKPAKKLCPTCINKHIAEQMEVPAPDPAEFPPIKLFDSVGKEHTFYFKLRLSTGLGITASEIDVNNSPCGYEFSIMKHPETPSLEAYSQLIEKIKKGLNERYLHSSDFSGFSSQNRLYIKNNVIIGRIEQKEDTPIVVIDGKEYTWEDIGQFVSSHEGFNFRLECIDPYDNIDFSSKVKRPDTLWWLKRQKVKDNETEKEIH